MKKIAIVTLYDDINIGNKLQNYAVQQICKSYDLEPVTLTYKDIDKQVTWKGYIISIIGFPKNKAKVKQLQMRRKRRFKEFSNKYLIIEKPHRFKEYKYLKLDFDLYIVGSDQVWHNWNDSMDELEYFFLRFVEKKKRLCIAPSFGFDEIPAEYKNVYKEGLEGFEYLSCREESGCNIIKSITNKEAQRIVDPTLMLDKSLWCEIEKKPEYVTPDRYLLVYFLGGMSDSDKREIDKLADSLELEIIDILNLNQEDYYCTRPDEFIYLVNRATFIVTNSFHGAVFSILFHKKFKVLQRVDEEGGKMQSRIDTLFNIFDIKSSDTDNLNYETIDELLTKERMNLDKYLKKIFEYRE